MRKIVISIFVCLCWMVSCGRVRAEAPAREGYVSLLEFSEKMSSEYEIFQEDREHFVITDARASDESVVLRLKVDSRLASLNGRQVLLQHPPYVEGDLLYLHEKEVLGLLHGWKRRTPRGAEGAGGPAALKNVSVSRRGDFTRIRLELSAPPSRVTSSSMGARLKMLSLEGVEPARGIPLHYPVEGGVVAEVRLRRSGTKAAPRCNVVVKTRTDAAFRIYKLQLANELVMDVFPAIEGERREPLSCLVVLDPGHGGRDEGCTLGRGMKEKSMALLLCRRLGRLLERRGVRCALSRGGDFSLPPLQRISTINEQGADLVVSLHLRPRAEADAAGDFTFFLPRPDSGECSPTEAEAASAERAARRIAERLEALGARCSFVYEANLLPCARIAGPSFLVECSWPPRDDGMLEDLDLCDLVAAAIEEHFLHALHYGAGKESGAPRTPGTSATAEQTDGAPWEAGPRDGEEGAR